MCVLAHDSGTSRPRVASRFSVYGSLPTDALVAQQLGREVRTQKADGLISVWSEDAPEFSKAHAYQVEEVLHWDDGEPSGLVVFYFVRRRPDLTTEAFEERYREGHAPLARVQHPGLRRYVQNFVRRESQGAPHWDAIAQLHFASEQSFRDQFYRDAASPAIVAADVREFADPTSGFVLVTRERTLR